LEREKGRRIKGKVVCYYYTLEREDMANTLVTITNFSLAFGTKAA
jgi:hypothetical protein